MGRGFKKATSIRCKVYAIRFKVGKNIYTNTLHLTPYTVYRIPYFIISPGMKPVIKNFTSRQGEQKTQDQNGKNGPFNILDDGLT
jgi:hypothetical protein